MRQITVGLDERLSTIAGQVRQGARVADIGCDHALLLCRLAKQKRIVSGIACDINENPLDAARRNARRFGVSDMLRFRLGNGLESVGCQEVDDIVIAGMGGETIAEILAGCPWITSPQLRLLLQPMTRADVLRRWLLENGFSILSEKACYSNKRYYTVIQSSFCGDFQKLDSLDAKCFIGALPIDSDPAAQELLKRTERYITRKAKGLAGIDAETSARYFALANALIKRQKG